MVKSEKIEQIAKDVLFIKTLKERHRDRLDFHDVHVSLLKEALSRAFDAGAQSTSRHLTEQIANAQDAAEDKLFEMMSGPQCSVCGDRIDQNGICLSIQNHYDYTNKISTDKHS